MLCRLDEGFLIWISFCSNDDWNFELVRFCVCLSVAKRTRWWYYCVSFLGSWHLSIERGTGFVSDYNDHSGCDLPNMFICKPYNWIDVSFIQIVWWLMACFFVIPNRITVPSWMDFMLSISGGAMGCWQDISFNSGGCEWSRWMKRVRSTIPFRRRQFFACAYF